MKSLIILFILAVYCLFSGLIGIYSKNRKKYIQGISNIIGGISLMFGLLLYYITGNAWLIIIGVALYFLLSGTYGILHRKETNNWLLHRIDVSYIIFGVISLGPIILYFLGYFDK